MAKKFQVSGLTFQVFRNPETVKRYREKVKSEK
jgi:hypothetical protein